MKRSPFKRKAPKASTIIPADVRAAVERRDATCVVQAVWDHQCWGSLQLHHKLPRSRGGEHTEDNLIRLCARAHDHVHGNPAWARSHDLLR